LSVLNCQRHPDVVDTRLPGGGGQTRVPVRYAVACWVGTRSRLT
jgi:hypothetical protein